MAELKTRPTRKDPQRYVARIGHSQRQGDCLQLLELMTEITGEQAVIWGDSIVGFGRYHYTQRNGQKATWPLTGFSPRKQSISIYVMPGFSSYQNQLKLLGKHKHSVSCLYINKLADIDLEILTQIIADSVNIMRERYPAGK